MNDREKLIDAMSRPQDVMRIAIIGLSVASLAMLEVANPSQNIRSRILTFAILLIAGIFSAHRLRGGQFVERLSATLPLVTAASWALVIVILAAMFASIYGLHATFKNTSPVLFVLFMSSPLAFALTGILAMRARSSAQGSILPIAVVLGSVAALSQFGWLTYANG